ncbi:MAG: hypothetical protein REH83_04570 [Rickettsiella sp.]|nr:hypothetical protein [Rickettsiella sp.]
MFSFFKNVINQAIPSNLSNATYDYSACLNNENFNYLKTQGSDGLLITCEKLKKKNILNDENFNFIKQYGGIDNLLAVINILEKHNLLTNENFNFIKQSLSYRKFSYAVEMIILLENNQVFNKENFYAMKDAGLVLASNNEKRISEVTEKEVGIAPKDTLSNKMIVILSLMTLLDEKKALNNDTYNRLIRLQMQDVVPVGKIFKFYSETNLTNSANFTRTLNLLSPSEALKTIMQCNNQKKVDSFFNDLQPSYSLRP